MTDARQIKCEGQGRHWQIDKHVYNFVEQLKKIMNAVLEDILQSVGPPELYERTLTRQKACYRRHILSKWCVRRDRRERLRNQEHLLKYKKDIF